MSRRPGIMLKLPDGRIVIRYNKQPLLQERNKVVLHLLNDNFTLQKDEKGNEKTVLRDVSKYNEMLPSCQLIGYVD